jgi:phosphohistidine phosphatase
MNLCKSLFIIRHAEAVANFGSSKDISRILNPSGKEQLRDLKKQLDLLHLELDLVLVSTAVRTQATFQELSHSLKSKEVIITEKLYEANYLHLLNIIHQLDNQIHAVAIIAHNPGLTQLLSYLGGVENTTLETGMVAHLEFCLESWEMIGRDSGVLQSIYR